MSKQFEALPASISAEWTDSQVIRVVNLGGELLSAAARKSFTNSSFAARETLRDGLYYESQFINSEGNHTVVSQPDIAPVIAHFSRLESEANLRDQLLETHLGRMDLFRRAIQGEKFSIALYKDVLTKFSVSAYPNIDSLPLEAIVLEERSQAEISGQYATGLNSPVEILHLNRQEAIKRLQAKRLLKLPSVWEAEKNSLKSESGFGKLFVLGGILGTCALATAIAFDYPPGIRQNADSVMTNIGSIVQQYRRQFSLFLYI